MFIFIVLFLLMSLLVSIVICRDNRYCVNILFIGYVATIFVVLSACAFMRPKVYKVEATEMTDQDVADFEREIKFRDLNEQEEMALGLADKD